MELLKCIYKSLSEQSNFESYGINIYTHRGIRKAFNWSKGIEGELFWKILDFSYSTNRVYDYDTIIKIFTKYGPKAFHINYNRVSILYGSYYDKYNNQLSQEGLDLIFKAIEKSIK